MSFVKTLSHGRVDFPPPGFFHFGRKEGPPVVV